MRDTGWNIWNWFAFFSSLIWFRTFGKHWTTTSHSSRDSKRKKWVYPHSVTQYNGQGQSQMNQWNHEGTAGKGVAGVSQRFWNWTIFWDKSLKNNLKRRGVHLNHAQKDPEKNGKLWNRPFCTRWIPSQFCFYQKYFLGAFIWLKEIEIDPTGILLDHTGTLLWMTATWQFIQPDTSHQFKT